jgi:hypothetical protein
LAERPGRGYLTGLVSSPGTAGVPEARAPHRRTWAPGRVDLGGRSRRLDLPLLPEESPEPSGPAAQADLAPGPGVRGASASRPLAAAPEPAGQPASQRPVVSAATPAIAVREPGSEPAAPARRRPVPADPGGEADRRSSSVPAQGTARPGPLPGLPIAPDATGSGARDAMARLTARSGPPAPATSAPPPRFPTERPDGASTPRAHLPAAPTAAPPIPPSRRPRRPDAPAVQIGSVEVVVTQPQRQSGPPVAPRPAPPPAGPPRTAAPAARPPLSRPAPPYGLAQR